MFWDIIIQGDPHIVVFIVCVNVLFLSNSQHEEKAVKLMAECLSYVSMSSF